LKVNSSGALEVVSGDSTAKGLFASSGKTRITIVDGTARTGLYAPDGSMYVVPVSEYSTYLGVYHPCGAMRGCNWTNQRGQFALNGAVYMDGLWAPYTGAEVHLDFVNQRYYWNGAERLSSDFTTFTGASFGTGLAAGLTGSGTAANHDISLTIAAMGITAPFTMACVVRPTNVNSTAQIIARLHASATPDGNHTSHQISTTNLLQHLTIVSSANQALQPSSAISNNTIYAISSVINTNLFYTAINGSAVDSGDLSGSIPTHHTLRLLENAAGNTPFTGAIRHILFFQHVGGAEPSNAQNAALSALLQVI